MKPSPTQTMKTTIRISGGVLTQYEYIESEIDSNDPDTIRIAYDALKAQFGLGEGVSRDEFNKALEELMSDGKFVNTNDLWERLSKGQQDVMQEVKKCLNRLEAKMNK